MIDLYTWPTPNGRKISILLEELKIPYKVHLIDINNNEQFNNNFSKISPSNKIPAIVDKKMEKVFLKQVQLCFIYLIKIINFVLKNIIGKLCNGFFIKFPK